MTLRYPDSARPGLATILSAVTLSLTMSTVTWAYAPDGTPASAAQSQLAPEQSKNNKLSEWVGRNSSLNTVAALGAGQSLRPIHIAQANGNQAPSSGSIITLDAPRINDYWITATRQASGTVVFDGYVPSEAIRKEFAAQSGANTKWLKLGSGEPKNYGAAVEFGLAVLDQLDSGRFALRGTDLTFTGIAPSDANYLAVTAALTSSAPRGFTVSAKDLLAPSVEHYQWMAAKASDGTIALSGMVPDPSARSAMLAAAGAGATQSLTFASGEPTDFIGSTTTALKLLASMSEGRVQFDGSGWTVSGTALSAADKTKLQAEFTQGQLAAAGWSMAVGEPLAAAATQAPTAPVDARYTFAARKSADGAVVLTGQMPAEPALKYFGAVTKADISGVAIAAGAPENFIPSAEAGMRALMLLPEGELTFANGAWSLSGTAADQTNRDAVAAAIPAAQPAWGLALALPELQNPVAAAPSVAQAVAIQPVATTQVAEAPPASAAPPAASPADIAACIAPLADFSARNAILFRSGAAVIAEDSKPALDELSSDLAACPDAVVHIEGHTDGDGDEQRNLALSVARAEAVVAALVERGVTAARLYAVGYGEAKPIADNDTPDGKRLNRRIVVTVSPEHY